MIYTGSTLNINGAPGSELNRRIGATRNEFKEIERVWKHSGITLKRKIEIYSACVVSKLQFNLHALWLTSAEDRKINAFHASSLRRILKIQHSYYSRISNEEVLQKARQPQLSSLLKKRRLLLIGQLARRSDNDILKSSILIRRDNELVPRNPSAPRRRGRPRVARAQGVYRDALDVAGSHASLQTLWLSKSQWESAVNAYGKF